MAVNAGAAGKSASIDFKRSLKASATAIHNLLEKAPEDAMGKVPNFKPNLVAFVGYLVAHNSHHCGQIAMLARQVVPAVPAKTGFGLCEWGSLWRECGFGK